MKERIFITSLWFVPVGLTLSAEADETRDTDSHLDPVHVALKCISCDLMTGRQLKIQLFTQATHSENLIGQIVPVSWVFHLNKSSSVWSRRIQYS